MHAGARCLPYSIHLIHRIDTKEYVISLNKPLSTHNSAQMLRSLDPDIFISDLIL